MNGGQLAITVLICLCVILCLSIRQTDSMEMMLLTKLQGCKCPVSHPGTVQTNEKKSDSRSELSVGLMCGICVWNWAWLFWKTALIRWGEPTSGVEWGTDPRGSCCGKCTVKWGNHDRFTTPCWVPHYLTKLGWIPSQKCSFRGTVWHLLCKRTNSVTHWNASKHLAVLIRHARLTTRATREHFVFMLCCERLTRVIICTHVLTTYLIHLKCL